MILLTCIIIGIIIGLIFKGSIVQLSALRILWMPIIGIVAGIIVKMVPIMPFWIKAILITFYYTCIIIFVIANRKYIASSILLGLGSLSNFVVIAVNNFRMPVSVKALSVYPGMTAQAVLDSRANYFIAADGAKLIGLGDMIYIPIPILKGFISIGDIFISVGMCMLIIFVMTDKMLKTPNKADNQ